MCIILTCEKYVRPDYELLERCFWNNPDGAGIMWCEDGRVCTAKGFYDPANLSEAIEYVPKDSRLVIHMRIATSGGIDVGTCHPFPICDDLDILHAPDVECSAALAHNGIISGMPTDAAAGISDTVSFVSLVVNGLYDVDGRVTKSMQRRIKEAAPGNRFAIMTDDGEVYRLGVGWETVTKGIQASNGSWRWAKSLYSWSGKSGTKVGTSAWDSAYWDDDDTNGYYDYYGVWHEFNGDDDADDYEGLFDICCGPCPNKGDCMTFGAICDDVAAYVDEWMADRARKGQEPDEDADWTEWAEYRMAKTA